MVQIRQTVSIEKARDLAEQGLVGEGFEKALAELGAMNYSQVDVTIDYGPSGSSQVGLAPVDGIMIGFFLPSYVGEQIALPGGEEVNGLHITLAYIGALDALNVNQQRTLIGVVAELARDSHALKGTTRGLNYFPANDPIDDEGDDTSSGAVVPLYAGVDVPGLFELRGALLKALDDAKIPYAKDHPNFVPHITLAYVPSDDLDEQLDAVVLQPTPLLLRTLSVAIGGAHFDSTLFGDVWDDGGMVPDVYGNYVNSNPASSYRPSIAIAKALTIEDEKRITLAPMYLPGTLDGHGEWVDGVDLEDSFHDWMDQYAAEGIRLQHTPEIEAGRVVEGYILREPLEVEVPVPGNESVMEKQLYPAGTPIIGTRWEPWAWELVKRGEIRGYSMGGSATPVEQDLA